MKRITYRYVMNEINHGTEDEPNIEQIFGEEIFDVDDSVFESNYALAMSKAYNGEVTVEEVADPETPDTPTGDDSIWEELDKAYQEGVDSV